jgi:rhodanese-related sulfurtransferase
MNVKLSLLEQISRVAKSLSHARRLELIDFLAQRPRTVEVLARLSGMSIANTSQHLQQLRAVGLVNARKDGLYVTYSLADNSLVDLLGMMRQFAERNVAELEDLIQSYLKVQDGLEALSAEELMERSAQGLASVIDVRPVEEFHAGHVLGAINIPMDELEQRLGELSPAQTIVAYCRGPYCLLAYDAVATLRENGFEAMRLEYGYPEWRNAGMPVDGEIVQA